MKKETFIQGMAVLKEAFQKRDMNMAVWQGFVWKLDDDAFLAAVKDIVATTRELYPDSNLIGMVIQRTNEIVKRTLECGGRGKITDERSDPPPSDWLELKEKLKKETRK